MSDGGPGKPRDAADAAGRGLQRERTTLAWERTGLTFVVVGALLLRVGGDPYYHPRHVPGAVAILLGGAMVAAALRAGSTAGAPGRARRRLAALRLVGVAAAGVSLAALVLVLLGG